MIHGFIHAIAKTVRFLKCGNYITYLRNHVTLKHGKPLIFALLLITISKSKS